MMKSRKSDVKLKRIVNEPVVYVFGFSTDLCNKLSLQAKPNDFKPDFTNGNLKYN